MIFDWIKHIVRVVLFCIGSCMLSCTSIASENIWDAIESENLKAIEEFLEHGIGLNAGRESDQRLPLMHATLHRKPEVIEFLLENGADVNGTDSVGNTCLMVASFLGAEDTVKALLAGGADLFRRNVIGEDVLDALKINWELTNYYANEVFQLGVSQKTIESGRKQVRPILVQARERAAKDDVWVALALNRLDYVKSHLEDVDDISTLVTDEGSPILVAATALGHVEIVKYLLQAGADIESRDAVGSTSLFVAAMFGYEEIAKVLLENKADTFTINYLGTDLNAALQLDWGFTNGIATLIGLSLDEAELKENRRRIKNLVVAHKESLETNGHEDSD